MKCYNVKGSHKAGKSIECPATDTLCKYDVKESLGTCANDNGGKNVAGKCLKVPGIIEGKEICYCNTDNCNYDCKAIECTDVAAARNLFATPFNPFATDAPKLNQECTAECTSGPNLGIFNNGATGSLKFTSVTFLATQAMAGFLLLIMEITIM